MSQNVTFHHPVFDQSINNKIGNLLEAVGGTGHCVKYVGDSGRGSHAISSCGFPSNINGTHVFVTHIDEIKDAVLGVGWTSTPLVDSSTYSRPGCGMSGCCLWTHQGIMDPNDIDSVPEEISENAKEIVSILTISENGKKFTAQWIEDGTEGVIHDVSTGFKGEGQIFSVMVLESSGQQAHTIPFSQVKSTSPKIEELRKQLNLAAPLPVTSLTNNEENEKLIAELRLRAEEGNRRLFEQKDKEIENMKEVLRQQLAAKDQQFATKDQQYELALKQLELERAEHQKTRNLLHLAKQEMKDMEIHFLKEQNKILMQKESGQRREREEEVNVKQERSD